MLGLMLTTFGPVAQTIVGFVSFIVLVLLLTWLFVDPDDYPTWDGPSEEVNINDPRDPEDDPPVI